MSSRQDIMYVEVSRVRAEVAVIAIRGLVQPMCKITHLVFCNSSRRAMSGPDPQLTRLLEYRPSVHHLPYRQGSSATSNFLHQARDFLENNRGARILVVCSEIIPVTVRAGGRELQPRPRTSVVVKDLQEKLKAANRKAEDDKAKLKAAYKKAEDDKAKLKAAYKKAEYDKAKLKAAEKKAKVDRINYKVISAEAGIFRSEFGIPRARQVETWTYTPRAPVLLRLN